MNDRSLVMVMTQGIGGASDQRGKVHAFDRFEARTPNRSGLHSRRFCYLKNPENCCPNAVGISATSTSNVTASHRKERIFDTNKARLCVVGMLPKHSVFVRCAAAILVGNRMKSAIEAHLPDEHFVIRVDGRVKSHHRRFLDALREGLQLRDQFPQLDVKVRAVQVSGELSTDSIR